MAKHALLRSVTLAVAGAVAVPAAAQFREPFDTPGALAGWEFFTGDGEATVDFRTSGEGYASILVDATHDRRGVWWALIKRQVSGSLDLAQLARPDRELRVEARIRASHAPRRVNLHVNTQRTTDFHSHLMEFDIPDTEQWHTISMTTRGFAVRPGDTVNAQLALMDWGPEQYRVDVDYLWADVVDPARTGPDLGEPLPYHPPAPEAATFAHAVPAAHDAVVDLANPDVNLNAWSIRDGLARQRMLTVGGALWVILRFDLGAYAGRRAAGLGLLELTTHSVMRSADDRKDFGLVRVAEILAGDPAWRRETVTVDSLRRGEPLERVVNTQMIVDAPVSEGDGGRTVFVISRPVLQRLLDGRTLGLAVKPLGAIAASFYAVGHPDGRGGRLLFNIESNEGR